MPKVWLLYDSRATGGDTDDAVVFDTARSLKEARRVAPSYGQCCIYEYDITDENELINERFVEVRG